MARTKDPGLAAALELSRLMGLRSQEAVQSAQSLKTWKQAVERGDTRLTVVFGTKGRRPRETVILDAGAIKNERSYRFKCSGSDYPFSIVT